MSGRGCTSHIVQGVCRALTKERGKIRQDKLEVVSLAQVNHYGSFKCITIASTNSTHLSNSVDH